MTTVEREPGTIIRDRYVLTAPAGGEDAAGAWRAVDMVLRRPVILVFDPPGTTEGSDGPGDDASDAPVVPALDTEPPAGVPVGEILDGGHFEGEFYRVFRTAGDTDPIDEPADPGLLTGSFGVEADDTGVIPLFGAIDGADATRPIGMVDAGSLPPPPAGLLPPVDPTIELPTPGLTPWSFVPVGPEPPVPPATGTVPAPVPSAPDALPDAALPARRPATPRPPAPRRKPMPLSVAAASVLCVVGVGGFLLMRETRSSSSQIQPPAAAEVVPTTTPTTLPETTTTETTVPETTTLPPTTVWVRPTTTEPPVTEPPETVPPSTVPPSTKPTTTVQPTTTRPPVTQTTTTRRPGGPGNGADDA